MSDFLGYLCLRYYYCYYYQYFFFRVHTYLCGLNPFILETCRDMLDVLYLELFCYSRLTLVEFQVSCTANINLQEYTSRSLKRWTSDRLPWKNIISITIRNSITMKVFTIIFYGLMHLWSFIFLMNILKISGSILISHVPFYLIFS